MSLKILLVEDDSAMRLGIAGVLRGAGHEVIEAENGKVGLEKYNSSQPQIIITDLMMPVLSGLDMISGIRQNDSSTPIIIITSNNDVTAINQALEYGVKDYFDKMDATPKSILALVSHYDS